MRWKMAATVVEEQYIAAFAKAKKRKGKCYQLAGQYAVDHPDTILVHGVAAFMPDITGLPFDHAWVELPGEMIWEPISQMTMTAKEWESIAKPEYWGQQYETWTGPSKRYDHEDVLIYILKERTWGPWRE